MNSLSGADDLFGQGWGATTPLRAGSEPPRARPFESPITNATELGPGFGSANRSASSFTVVHPPLVWLYVAVSASTTALALVIVFWGSIPVAVISWILGGPVAIALTSVFQSIDTSRRTELGYSSGRSTLVRALYIAALGLGLGAVIVTALNLALWAGRGF